MLEILHMSQGNYSMYENDNRIPTIDIVERVVEHFNVTYDWLLANDKQGNVIFESVTINNGNASGSIENQTNNYTMPKELIEEMVELIKEKKK